MFTGYPSYFEAALLLICLGMAFGLTAAFGNAADRYDAVSLYAKWVGFAVTIIGFCMMIYLVYSKNIGEFATPDARKTFNVIWLTVLVLCATGVYEFIQMRKRQQQTINE